MLGSDKGVSLSGLWSPQLCQVGWEGPECCFLLWTSPCGVAFIQAWGAVSQSLHLTSLPQNRCITQPMMIRSSAKMSKHKALSSPKSLIHLNRKHISGRKICYSQTCGEERGVEPANGEFWWPLHPHSKAKNRNTLLALIYHLRGTAAAPLRRKYWARLRVADGENPKETGAERKLPAWPPAQSCFCSLPSKLTQGKLLPFWPQAAAGSAPLTARLLCRLYLHEDQRSATVRQS